MKIIYSESIFIDKMEQKYVRENGIYWYKIQDFLIRIGYYELLKIKDQKNPEINTSEKIFKLTGQMLSKSWNLYINRKLSTRGFQRDQNYQIPIYILKLIDPESQRPNTDWNEQCSVKR